MALSQWHGRLRRVCAALLITTLRSLPPRSIGPLGWVAGSVWHALDRRHRTRVRENLRVAFGPPRDAAARRHLERSVFRNMARVPLEAIWSSRLLATPAQIERRCTFHGPWPPPGGRPGAGVLVSGHLGNWEALIHAARHRLGALRTVVRPVPQPEFDRIATALRGGRANVIAKHGAYRGVLRSLRAGYWVAMAGDQGAGPDGPYVPFFGLLASTQRSPARLALRADVPLVLAVALRRPGPDLHLDVHLEALPDPPRAGSRGASVEALLRALNERLEHFVRHAPEQYNFLHRRWKHRPSGEPAGVRLPRYDHHRKTP